MDLQAGALEPTVDTMRWGTDRQQRYELWDVLTAKSPSPWMSAGVCAAGSSSTRWATTSPGLAMNTDSDGNRMPQLELSTPATTTVR